MDYDQLIICKFFGYPRPCIRGSICVTPSAANMNLWTKRTTEISQNHTLPSFQTIGASQVIAPQMMGASHGETLQVMGASHEAALLMSNSHEVTPPSKGIPYRESPTINESVQEKKKKRPRPNKQLRERKRKRRAQGAEQQAAIFSNRITAQSTNILQGTEYDY